VTQPVFFAGATPRIPNGPILFPLSQAVSQAVGDFGLFEEAQGVLEEIFFGALLGPLWVEAVHGIIDLPKLQAAVNSTIAGTVTAQVQSRVDAAFATAFANLPTAQPENSTFGSTFTNRAGATNAGFGGTATIESAAPITNPSIEFNCLPFPPVICDPNVDCGGKQPSCFVSFAGLNSALTPADICGTNLAWGVDERVSLAGEYKYVGHGGGTWTWHCQARIFCRRRPTEPSLDVDGKCQRDHL